MRTTRPPVRRRPAVAGIRRPTLHPTTKPPTDADSPAASAPSADADSIAASALSADADPLAAGVSSADAEPLAIGEPPVPTDSTDDEPLPSRRALVLPIALLAAAALLVATGIWALAQTSTANETNTALVDTTATTEVTRQVREGLEQIFTYRHDATATTETAARTVLTGPARDQYERLFRQVREQAPAQQLTLTTKVVSSGVVTLHPDKAVLLVFLDQSATRGDTGEATTAGAQLSVTATQTNGRWQISDLIPR
jgi:Mce-associated membrane protein